MNLDAETARMKSDGFWFTERPDFYRRKRDGFRVRAADWPDGDVTWMLDPLPIIPLSGHAVGTCSAKTFERNHERIEDARN